ncbi:TRAF-interacting protein with FHA domain-containing protein A isoform X2 [Microcaecilia unicolor]|nr:TRAF-interacting protein with FHA domain-containing protein A isoform X2 [Microcaecilia unicolor]XP_030048386.1 TRAF-interacting protein with FHA domain-containing protein A isoform X2 [Microcaecilia unicolor]XP_030048387.1 TRAF-interacting protein with FHA domain-containing protein A isoform X2 [Microcaecilia unicolor]XP_030048388.1 TRAF-interacting protein with FHA domain-containing protein A isoform X2 [Microcaecilia unicolor]
MSSFEETETEETVHCLHMKIYHPFQAEKQVFRSIPLFKKDRYKTDEMVKFGRDNSSCKYVLLDNRVSRIQFALQLFRHRDSSELCFEIKNLSRRTKLLVDNMELDYLNKTELPYKCILRFGDYQILVEREGGESLDYFEICFELAARSLLQEMLYVPCLQPIPENGYVKPDTSLPWSSNTLTPIEVDESES